MSTAKQRILSAREKFEIREQRRITVIQTKCPHLKVAHWSGVFPGGTLTFPVRVCLDCGIEEEGSWWSYSGTPWSAKGFGKAILGNSPKREIKTLGFDEFNRERL